jgi:hypothetical protein
MTLLDSITMLSYILVVAPCAIILWFIVFFTRGRW